MSFSDLCTVHTNVLWSQNNADFYQRCHFFTNHTIVLHTIMKFSLPTYVLKNFFLSLKRIHSCANLEKKSFSRFLEELSRFLRQNLKREDLEPNRAIVPPNTKKQLLRSILCSALLVDCSVKLSANQFSQWSSLNQKFDISDLCTKLVKIW